MFYVIVIVIVVVVAVFFLFKKNIFRTVSIHAAQASLKLFSLLSLPGTTGWHYHACLKDKL